MNTPRQLAYLVGRMLVPGAREKARHDYFDVFLTSKEDISKEIGDGFEKASVLVLGCGYTYPDVALWSTVAERVVGIDVAASFYRNGWSRLYRSCRAKGAGPLRSLLEASYRRRGVRSYYGCLSKYSRTELDVCCQDMLSYRGDRLPFKDGSFDVVCSNAVLEHVSDIDGLCAEISRVTSKQGLSYHLWHNYYSLSGAHVPEYISRAHPWGHLLDDPDVNRHLMLSGTPLNKKLPDEIWRPLCNHFSQIAFYPVDVNHRKRGVDPGFSYEGESLLDPGLESRLSQYSREVLLTRAYLFVGRKVT